MKNLGRYRKTDMQFRMASIEEFDSVRVFYWNLIDKIAGHNNTVGWKKDVYPSEAFLKESIENSELYVLDSENGLLSCVIVNNSWNDGYNGITWSIDCERKDVIVPHALAVRFDIQGKGIGEKVMSDIINIAKSENKKTIRLDIIDGNIAAERLYKKMGFKYVQTERMYYPDTGWTDFSMYELIL